MSIEAQDGILATLGLKIVNVVCGTLSSLAGLRFFDGLSVADRWLTVIGGCALSWWGAAPLADTIGMSQRAEILLVILLGLLGMALAAEVLKAIREVQWSIIINGILNRLTRK